MQLQRFVDNQQHLEVSSSEELSDELSPVVTKLPLELNDCLSAQVEKVKSTLSMQRQVSCFKEFNVEILGGNTICKQNLSAKSTVQLFVQLALYKFFGHHPTTVQTASLGGFRGGRVGHSHTVNTAVVEFCHAMKDTATPSDSLDSLLRKATTAITKGLMNAGEGKDPSNHLQALQWALEPNEPIPALFSNPAIKKLLNVQVTVDTFEHGLKECGNIMGRSEGIFLHFQVYEERYVS